MKFRNCPRLEIKCEDFREFFNSERAGSHRDADEESLGRFPLWFLNLSQSALICRIKRRWQSIQNIQDIPWEAVGEVCELTIYPSEPIGCTGERDKKDEV